MVALECVDSGATTFDNFMDTFIPPSIAPANGTTYTAERFRDFPVGPGSDFYQQQQRFQQAFQSMTEDQDDEFTVPECFYDIPVAINTPVPSPSQLQTVEIEDYEHVVEAEDTQRVTAPPNITVSTSPQAQHVAEHEHNGAAFEPDNAVIAQTNIDLYLPEHVLDFRVDLDNRTITVENCWGSKFPLFLGVILLLLGVMFDCPESIGGGAGTGARGVVQRDLGNHAISQRVTGPPLALDYDVDSQTTTTTTTNSSSSSGSSDDDDGNNAAGSSIFRSVAGILSDMGQSLVNVFGLDRTIHGTLPETVSVRTSTS